VLWRYYPSSTKKVKQKRDAKRPFFVIGIAQ